MTLNTSTARADAVREDCLCVQDCGDKRCSHQGRWHNHASEVCPLHPDTVID